MAKNYYRIAQEAAQDYLNRMRSHSNGLVSLYSLSCIVDGAVRAAGKKGDMYSSLFDYEDLVPVGWHCSWMQNKRGGDKIYYVVPNGFHEAESRDLLLGAGTLVEVSGPD
jgi:hypothetical protein